MDNRFLERFRRQVLRWFEKNRRTLPWRDAPTPYRVWVSEIMLQQTTTETVSGYFDRFLTRFPTVEILAAADLAEVLTLWQGLGYYRRAAQLHRTAKIIVEKLGGRFPETREGWLALPGIGRYTAGAILSIAFDRREPILEANTVRLHARLLALRSVPTEREAQKILWEFAERILPRSGSGLFNQALMDIGSRLCSIRSPGCDACPVFPFCEAAKAGTAEQYPLAAVKIPKENRTESAILFRRSLFTGKKADHERFLFVQYPEKIRWAGLWDFPRFLLETDGSPSGDSRLKKKLTNLLTAVVERGEKTVSDVIPLKTPIIGPPLTRMNHGVTRYKIELLLCEATFDEARAEKTSSPADSLPPTISFAGGTVPSADLVFRWLTPDQAAELPMNSTARRLLKRLNIATDA